jgi:hypothetical protein
MLLDTPGVAMESVHEPPRPTLDPGPRNANHRLVQVPHRSGLPFYVLTFVLLATVVGSLIWYDLRATYHDTLAYWDSNLSDSADQQVGIVTLWLLERRTDTVAVAHNPLTARLLLREANRASFLGIRQDVEHVVKGMAHANGFLGGVVADAECRVATGGPSRPTKSTWPCLDISPPTNFWGCPLGDSGRRSPGRSSRIGSGDVRAAFGSRRAWRGWRNAGMAPISSCMRT